jgi:tRNA-splicing ligase RtcB (3'-phosphate/5'-hydroxy nucleic acid ligase)
MNKLNISGEDLKNIGYKKGPAIGIAIRLTEKYFRSSTKEEALSALKLVVDSPEQYLEDDKFAELAQKLLEKPKDPHEDTRPEIPLKEKSGGYAVYGASHIEQGAVDQMEIAIRLPITVAGSLMPDAHQGYGLPIGGVLATNNAVIPYGVGVDIGCRMCLSIYDIPQNFFEGHAAQFKRELIAHTKFGAGNTWQGKDKADHDVLSSETFGMNELVRGLYDKAASQLGTSGGGNHFVEWGVIEILADDAELNISKGNYLALLSHSGSRGFGATVAGYYTKLAKEICKLPKEASNLAYLDLDSPEGQEYWLAMNLAGDYASACHEVIHERMTKAIGGTLLARVENHHNFAWKEIYEGKEVIVHRKGATPASKGVLGIIPGSMTAPGFLVRGKGEEASINSASHGAGRQMSRTQAIKSITKDEMRTILKDHGVSLIGAGLDEAPMAYKDINLVMASQSELVAVLGKFIPKIVRMADDGSRED